MKNTNYWNAEHVKLDKINYKVIQENATAVQAYVNGELNLVSTEDENWSKQIEAERNSVKIEVPDSSPQFIMFKLSNEYFQNTKIRQALAISYDRQAMVDDLRSGRGVPNYSVMLDTMKIAEWLKQTWEEALGITVQIDLMEWNIMWDKINEGDYDVASAGGGPYYNEPSAILSLFDPENGYFNSKKTGWNNEDSAKLKELFATANGTTDEKELAELYLQAEDAKKTYGERRKVDVESVKILDDRGVNVAIITDSPILSEESLYHHVGEAVREGVSQERAIRMVTINPARMMGVNDRIGSLEKGKDADIILVKGRLGLDTNANVQCTIINEEIVSKAEIN